MSFVRNGRPNDLAPNLRIGDGSDGQLAFAVAPIELYMALRQGPYAKCISRKRVKRSIVEKDDELM